MGAASDPLRTLPCFDQQDRQHGGMTMDNLNRELEIDEDEIAFDEKVRVATAPTSEPGVEK